MDAIQIFLLIFASQSAGSWLRRGTTSERSGVTFGGLFSLVNKGRGADDTAVSSPPPFSFPVDSCCPLRLIFVFFGLFLLNIS